MLEQYKNKNLVIVAKQMQYSLKEEERMEGKILERIADELGDYLKYVFYMRKPGYLTVDNIFVRLLIEEYINGKEEKGLTMQMIKWLKQNMPHDSFAKLSDVHVWTDCKPKEEDMKYFTIYSSEKYSFAIGTKNDDFGTRKKQYRLYVWKN